MKAAPTRSDSTSPFPRRRRYRSAAPRPRRPRFNLRIEALEGRLVPATYTLGGLEFQATGEFDTSGATVTNSGSISVGLVPGSNQSYQPLLQLDGNLTLNLTDAPSFEVDGTIATAFDGTAIPLFDAGSHTFDIDNLLNEGLADLDGKSLTVAGATFTLDEMKLVASPSNGPEVQLQGSLAIPALAGLVVTVDGPNHVSISGAGVALTGVDATINGSIQLGGLSFDATNLEIGYSRSGGHDRFTIQGGTSFALGSQSLAVQWGGQSGGGTATDGLVIEDGALKSLDMSVTSSFDVGSLGFAADDLTMTYAAATPSTPEQFAITGDAHFTLESDTVAVQLGNAGTAGLVIQGGALTNLDMAVTGGFTIGGLSLQADALTVTYAAATPSAPATYTMSGSADFTVEGDTIAVQLGGAGTAGLVIQGGALTNLDMAVTGSFTILGVTVAAQGLTFEYDASLDQYEMSGSLSISTPSQPVGSGNGQVFNGVTATLGTAGSPGLIFLDGTLQQLDVTINGQFDLFGLTVAPTNLQIAYNAGDDVLQITGGLTVSELFSASADLPDGGLTIDIATGSVTVDGLVLSLSDVDLGAFTIQQFQVSYEQTAQGTDINASIELAFPGGWAVGGSIAIIDGAVEDISINYAVTEGEGIPVGPTGLFLTSMSATVDNLEQPDDLIVSGSLTVVLGPEVTIQGQSVAIVSATGTFTIDPSSLVITADVSLADGLIGQGSGTLTANWATGFYSLAVDISLFDGTFDVTGELQFNNQGDLLLTAQASVNVPEAVPIIGGDTIGDVGFAFLYLSNGGNPTGFAAAWTTIDLWFTSKTVGFQYDLDGNFSLLGSSGVADVENALSLPPSVPAVPQPIVTQYASLSQLPTYGGQPNPAGAPVTLPAGASTLTLTLDIYSPWQQIALVQTVNGAPLYVDLASFPVGQAGLVDLNGGAFSLYNPASFPLSSPSIDVNSAGYTVVNNNGGFIGQTPDPAPIFAYITVVQESSNTDTVLIQAAADLGTTTLPAGPYALSLYWDGVSPGLTTVESSTASFVYLDPTLGAPTIGGTSAGSPITATGTIAASLAGTTTVDFYATTTPGGTSGVPIGSASAAAGTVSVAGNGSFTATLTPGATNLAPGLYYVYALVQDGQNSPVVSPTSATPFPTAAILGQVVDLNGGPVAGVQVQLAIQGAPDDAPPLAATTDADGNFALGSPGTAFNRVVTIVPPPGFELTTTATVPVAYDGSNLAAADFTLTGLASIWGTVTDPPAGSTVPDVKTPMAGVRVFLDLDGDGVLDAGEPSIVTNHLGQYHFREVTPGVHHVAVVQPEGYTPNSATARDVTVAHPYHQAGGVDFDFARPDAAPQSTVLYPTRATVGATNYLGFVSGRATDPDGRADLVRILVTIRDQTTGRSWDGTSFVAAVTPIELIAHGTATWSVPLPQSALIDGHSYAITSVAVDRFGRTQDVPSTRTFVYSHPVTVILPSPSPTPTPIPTPMPTPTPTPTPTFQPVGTTTTLESAAAAVVSGEPITFTIRVALATLGAGVPGGSVQLLDGDRVLAVLTLDGGTATYRTMLPIGAHAMSARYLGDAGALPSTSAVLSQSVSLTLGDATTTRGGRSTIAIGGTEGNDRITITGHGRRVRVVVRSQGSRRPLFARTYRADRLAGLDLFGGAGRDIIRLKKDLPARLRVRVHDDSGADVVRGAGSALAVHFLEP